MQPRSLSNTSRVVPDDISIAPPSPAPIPSFERINSIDILRGFALLGILPINILTLALPWEAYQNPTLAGGFSGTNFAAWLFFYVFFDQKMMTLFSMLFGAGLVLMTDRVAERGKSPAAFFYRRAAILLVIGIVHAYLLWQGDILVSYALCGMIVYPLRKLSPPLLMVLGLLVLLPPAWFMRSDSASLAKARSEVPGNASLGVTVESDQGHKTEGIQETIHTYRQGSYMQLARNRAPSAFAIQTTMFARTLVWTVSGRMLLGMALMKLGVVSAQFSLRFYLILAAFGYGLGLPVVGWGAYQLIANDFEGSAEFNEFGSLLVALGYIATVASILKIRLATWLTSRLAAVGRMALSNYLMQSLICTTLFYGYGFALFGTLDRIQLLGVAIAIWALQLSYSPIWLNHFRFGPVEWLWRSLTYGEAQSMWNPSAPR